MKNKLTLLTQKKLINLSKKNLRKTTLIKSLVKGFKNTAGKNNLGRITVFHKGSGHKKKYRKIDFMRNKDSIGIVSSLEYDPCRTALIASVYDFLNFNYFYMIAPKNLNIGHIVKSGVYAEIKVGHSLPLIKIPIGSFIHNISLKKYKKAQLSRSAGASSQLIKKTPKFCQIVLGSKQHKSIPSDCIATIGVVSNEFSLFKIIGKAGRNRWLSKRPTVRGVAMNPIDHPHGGGEGKTSGGRSSVTPWGKCTKNGKNLNKIQSKF